jgi:hypothetical protein
LALDNGKLIDVCTKSIEFRQNLVIVILGAIGYALSKSWLDHSSSPDKKVFRRLLPGIIISSFALIVMLYEERRMVQSISQEAFHDLSQQWLNVGEPLLDGLIILSAITLLVGLKR